MILILASEFDQQAQALAQLWQGMVVTPADLSKCGWSYQLPASAEGAVVASGQIIPARDITGVLTLLSSIDESDLPGIAREDQAYVAAEMHAFLVAWLDSLECPVLNRPTPGCLCGPASELPSSCGIASGLPVVVAGKQCFGAATSREAERALDIAGKAGVELLEISFRDGDVAHASFIPNLSDPLTAAAVYRLMTSQQQRACVPRVSKSVIRKGSCILLWGLPADGPLSRVHEELLRLGAPVWLLDQREVLDTEVGEDRLRVRGKTVFFEEVKSVYLRCYDSTQLPHVLVSSEEARRQAAAVDAGIARWVGTTDAFVISPLDAMSANNSKPYQLRAIAKFGWRIPETLITTDPVTARSFWKRHGEVIYKSISGIRSRVSRLSACHEPRLNDVAACPTQFQQFIPGSDYRVHVVGNETFACQVVSESDDYRYAEGNVAEYVACEVPPEIQDRCCRMSAAMGLPVSGIDLRLTPEGDWVCFEVNPSPGFTAYEDVTGQPIGAAIARLLVNPPDERQARRLVFSVEPIPGFPSVKW